MAPQALISVQINQRHEGCETRRRWKGARMNAFKRIFLHNWWLKLLALVLALAVYYSLRDSARKSGISPVDSMKGTFNDRIQATK